MLTSHMYLLYVTICQVSDSPPAPTHPRPRLRGQMTGNGRLISFLSTGYILQQRTCFYYPAELTRAGFGSSDFSPYYFIDEEERDLALTC